MSRWLEFFFLQRAFKLQHPPEMSKVLHNINCIDSACFQCHSAAGNEKGVHCSSNVLQLSWFFSICFQSSKITQLGPILGTKVCHQYYYQLSEGGSQKPECTPEMFKVFQCQESSIPVDLAGLQIDSDATSLLLMERGLTIFGHPPNDPDCPSLSLVQLNLLVWSPHWRPKSVTNITLYLVLLVLAPSS